MTATETSQPQPRPKGGRPKLPPDQKRAHSICIAVCAAELNRVERLAQDAGFPNIAEFCRHAALGRPPRPTKADLDLARELAQLRSLLTTALREHAALEPLLNRLLDRLEILIRLLRGEAKP